MRRLFTFLLGVLLCVLVTIPAKSESLEITVNVKNNGAENQIVGADIYTYVGDKLYEVTYQPEELPFKMNLKAGALRIRSFWVTKRQLEGKKVEKPVTEK